MKRIVLVIEGAADFPSEALDGATPLQKAPCRELGALARQGRCGLLASLDEDAPSRVEDRLLRLLGVPVPMAREVRRGALEALVEGIAAEGARFVYCAELVTLDGSVLREAAVPHLAERETQALFDAVAPVWRAAGYHIQTIGPGCALIFCRDCEDNQPEGLPPILFEGQDYGKFFPARGGGQRLRGLLKESRGILEAHSINEVRVDLEENPANGIWLWGGGPVLQPGAVCSGQNGPGFILTQSRLARGLGRLCDRPVIPLDDPWVAKEGLKPIPKIAGLVDALREHERALIYIGAPGRWGRYGDPREKVRALALLDQFVIGPLRVVLEAHRPLRMLVTSDLLFSSERGRPVAGPLPLLLLGEGIEADGVSSWDEASCANGALGTLDPEEAVRLLNE